MADSVHSEKHLWMRVGLIFLFIAGALFGQTLGPLPQKTLIKTDLCAYIPGLPLNTGKGNLQVERMLGNRTSFACDIGMIYSYGRSPLSRGYFTILYADQQTTRGWSIGTEFRIYHGRNPWWAQDCQVLWPLIIQRPGTPYTNTGFYTAFQVFYQYTWSDLELISRGRNIVSPVAERSRPGLLFRLGFQSGTSRNVMIDQSIGLGIHYTIVTSSHNVDIDPNFVSLFSSSSHSGVFPLVSYCFRIGLSV